MEYPVNIGELVDWVREYNGYTLCASCRGEDDLRAQYEADGSFMVEQVLHKNRDVTKECRSAQPGLGRYGWVVLFRKNKKGSRYLCTSCGKQAASYRSVGDTRVLKKEELLNADAASEAGDHLRGVPFTLLDRN